MSLMKSTAYRVDLSLNVITHKDGREYLNPVTIVTLTGLIFWLWAIVQTVNIIRFETFLMAQDVSQTMSMAGKVAVIIITALLWGIGLKL